VIRGRPLVVYRSSGRARGPAAVAGRAVRGVAGRPGGM